MNKDILLQLLPLDHVFEEYLAATPAGNDHNILAEYIARYPKYSQELTELAAERDLVEFDTEPAVDEADRLRLEEQGRALHRRLVAESAAEPTLSSLTEAAKKLGLRKDELAARLGISISLLQYLEKRRLIAASIPDELVTRITTVIGVAAEQVKAFLALAPATGTGANFKNASRPDELVQRDFREVVAEDGNLSEQQKRELLSL